MTKKLVFLDLSLLLSKIYTLLTVKWYKTMNRFNQLKELVDALEGDFEKFYEKGNNAAGTRVRKGMQEMKNVAQEIRIEVQSKKNS